jgi:hypothetical protein
MGFSRSPTPSTLGCTPRILAWPNSVRVDLGASLSILEQGAQFKLNLHLRLNVFHDATKCNQTEQGGADLESDRYYGDGPDHGHREAVQSAGMTRWASCRSIYLRVGPSIYSYILTLSAAADEIAFVRNVVRGVMHRGSLSRKNPPPPRNQK